MTDFELKFVKIEFKSNGYPYDNNKKNFEIDRNLILCKQELLLKIRHHEHKFTVRI